MQKFEIKHSPSPWTIGTIRSDITEEGKGFKYTSGYVRDANGLALTSVMGIERDDKDRRWTDMEHVVPNAHLIAAAPLLLSALIKAVDDIEETDPDPEVFSWYNEAKEAIAAAGITVKTEGV